MAETLAEWDAHLAAASTEIDVLGRPALLAGGEAVAGAARSYVRVASGRTRDSITSDPAPDNPDAVEIGPTTTAGPFLERGTAHSPAQPFLSPAVDDQAPVLEELLGLAGVRALGA